MAEAQVREIPVPAEYGGASLAGAVPKMIERLARIPREIEEIDRRRAALAREHGAWLVRTRQAVHDRLSEIEAVPLSQVTDHAFVIEGWLPGAARPRLERRLREELGEDVIVLLVEIADPAERLLRRGDVVTLGAEAHDRRADVAQVDAHPVARDDLGRGQTIADEELIDDPLDLLGIEVDVAAPPFLEFQEALRLGVDVGPHLVVLGPQRVRRVEVLEVRDQIGAVELAGAEVAAKCSEPASAEKPAAIAHRVLALHSGPIGHRRARQDDRPDQIRPRRGEHHHRPPRLAVADDARLAVGVGM